jgi:hypothetical protein
MAHFAQLDEDNKVIQIIVVNNEDIMYNGKENEGKGIRFCKQLLGKDTRWVQTSYNGKFRKQYAGVGFIYDKEKDEFLAPEEYKG